MDRDIIMFDWCDRIIQNIPASWGTLTCSDVQACINWGYIMSQLSWSPSIIKNGTSFEVNMNYILNNFNSSWLYPNITIGNSVYNLSNILDNFSFELFNSTWLINITNGWSARIIGRDWMRVNFVGTDIQIWLPTTNRQNWYVLTWNESTLSAQRSTISDCLCEQIANCAIIQSLQNQINTISSVWWGWWWTDDFTIGWFPLSGTQTIRFNRVLWGTYDVDISPFFSSLYDNFVNKISFWGTTLTLDMVSGVTLSADLSSLLDNVDAQTLSRDPVTNNLTISNGNTVNISSIASSWADELVKVSASDTVSSYLRDAIGNVTTTTTNNDWTIVVRINNPSVNENIQLIVDLTIYNGDTQFVGNHTQTGDTTTTGFTNLGTDLVFNNTNTTGIQNFDTNYTANYDNSVINYTNWTTVNQDSTSVYNNEWITNYSDNSIVNIDWNVNYWPTSTQTYIAWSTITGNVSYTDLTITGTNVNQTYDNTSQVNYDGTTINHNGTTTNYTGDSIVNLVDGATITNNLDWDVNNNYWPTYTENNVYTAGSEINNTWDVIVNNIDLTTTTNNTNVTNEISWDVTNNYSDTYVENNDGGTFNITNQTINYNDTPVLIDCTPTQLFDTTYTYPTSTQFVELVIEYDGVQETIRFTPNSWIQLFTVNGEQFSVNAGAIGYEYTIVSGTVWLWSITSSCHYNGVSVINQNNVITNNNWGVTNNENTTVNNVWVTEVYDTNSTVTYEWDVIFEGNIEVTGQIVWANRAYIEEFVATAGQTDFTVANTPASNAFVRVSTTSGLYGKQGAIRDYTVSGSTITLNTPALAWDVITIQYIESLGTPVTWPTITGITTINKWVSPAMNGTTLVVTDATCTTSSVITRTAQSTPAWFIEIIPWTGSFTINSSASETALVFNYITTT